MGGLNFEYPFDIYPPLLRAEKGPGDEVFFMKGPGDEVFFMKGPGDEVFFMKGLGDEAACASGSEKSVLNRDRQPYRLFNI
jgi:hypothetical protein